MYLSRGNTRGSAGLDFRRPQQVFNNPPSSITNASVIKDVIQRHPLFRGCTHKFTDAVASCVCTTQYEQGRHVVSRGGHFTSMVLVLYGEIDVGIDGTFLQRLEKRSTFWEAAIMGFGDVCPMTLQVSSECAVVGLLSFEEFAAVISSMEYSEDTPRFAVALETCVSPVCHGFHLQPGIDPLDVNDPAAGTQRHKDARSTFELDPKELIMPRFMFPGDLIVKSSGRGEELLVLLKGKASVERDAWADRARGRPGGRSSGQLPSEASTEVEVRSGMEPVNFGLNVLLGISEEYEETVTALSHCWVGALSRRHLAHVMKERHECFQVHDVASFLQEYRSIEWLPPVVARAKQVDVFKFFGRNKELMTMWAASFETRLYPPQYHILSEDSKAISTSMYNILDGSVSSWRNGTKISSLTAGMSFNEFRMFGMVDEPSTVISNTLVLTEMLTGEALLKGFKEYPHEVPKIMHLATRKLSGSPDSNMHEAKKLAVHSLVGLMGTSNFGATSTDFVEFIGCVSEKAIDRVYMPGHLIMVQGDIEDTMKVMVSGTATVLRVTDPTHDDPEGVEAERAPRIPTLKRAVSEFRRRGKQPAVRKEASGRFSEDREKKPSAKPSFVCRLNAGSISGELAMLGINKRRAATVQADTICCMWEITSKVAMANLVDYPDCLQHFRQLVTTNLEASVKMCIDSLPLLGRFDHHFRMKMALFCERQAYFPGEDIVLEGKDIEGMHVLCKGEVAMKRKGQMMMVLQYGDHVNSLVMLGSHTKSYFTLTALRTCHLLFIPRLSYLQVLEANPTAREPAQQMDANERAAFQEFKAFFDQFSRKTCRIRVRRNLASELDGWSTGATSREACLSNAFRAWCRYRKFVLYKREQDQKCRSSMRNVDEWISGRRSHLAALGEVRASVTADASQESRSIFSLTPLLLPVLQAPDECSSPSCRRASSGPGSPYSARGPGASATRSRRTASPPSLSPLERERRSVQTAVPGPRQRKLFWTSMYADDSLLPERGDSNYVQGARMSAFI